MAHTDIALLRQWMLGILLLLGSALCRADTTSCFEAAASQYQIPAGLLRAVATVESGLDPQAVAHARNRSYSVGLMQINSSWFEQLADRNIRESDLYDPCTSISVGAWILAGEIQRYGYTWEAIGAYYAGAYTKDTRDWKLPSYRQYATKVLNAWRQQIRRSQASSTELPKRSAVRDAMGRMDSSESKPESTTHPTGGLR